MTCTMRPRETREWAKEMVLSAIDERLDRHEGAGDWEPDDQRALLLQRNRVARMLGLPERQHPFSTEHVQ